MEAKEIASILVTNEDVIFLVKLNLISRAVYAM